MAGAPAFYELPEELLAMIAESVPPRPQYNDIARNSTLGSLRLVHPRFAYLKAIMREMFTTLELPAECEALDRMAKTDWQKLAPFAQEIVLRHSAYCVDLTYDRILEIIRDHLPASRRKCRTRACDVAVLAEEICGGEMLRPAYEAYLRRAKADRRDVLSGRAEEVLSSVFTDLPGLRSFAAGSPFLTRWERKSVIENVIMNHTTRGDDDSLVASLGDDLLKLLLRAIKRADVAPKEMEVNCAITADIESIPADLFAPLDLSQLTKFCFWGYVGDEGEADSDAREEQAGALIGALMSQAATTLRHLELCAPQSIIWEPPEIACPSLEYLRLEGLEVGYDFEQWLKGCTKLEHFRMGMVHGMFMETLWTIRNMQPMRIEMDEIYLPLHLDLSLDHHTSKPSDYTYTPEDDERYREIAPAAVAGFLSGADASPALLIAFNQEEWLMPRE